MQKKEILAKAKKYEIVPAGPEGSQVGYLIENMDITIVFDSKGYVESIECGENADVLGARITMNFNEIQKKLGAQKIQKTIVETEEHIAYDLVYYYGELKVIFSSYDKMGKEAWLIIYNNKRKK